ncbi:hypothetical protein [Bradyrhizobium betae]|jgi:hypothetical protein|nr:hypothetical protein [Bradyrhizobium betae]MCS3731048.1 hypothetical protein [Bradyrhizobium betae]
MMMANLSIGAHAQSLTPDPGTWRPMSYANLQKPSPQSATYSDIWKDAIDANNRAYKARGDQRFSDGNAPVSEAHFVIWSSGRSVVLSVLNTAIACSIKQVAPDAGATVKLCPMRIAIYEGLQVRTMDGGSGCFLELEGGPLSDREASAAYASYDIASKTVKIGMIVNHQAVDECSKSIPLYPQ